MITASGLLNKDIALWTLLEFLFISKLGELIIDLGQRPSSVKGLIFFAGLSAMIFGFAFQAVVLLALVACEVRDLRALVRQEEHIVALIVRTS